MALTTVLLGLTGVGAAALVAGADRHETVAVTDDTTTSSVPEETTTTAPPETTTTTTAVATTSTTTPPPTLPVASCRTLPQENAPPSHIDVWVFLEKSRFAQGETIPFVLRARNRSEVDETYDYSYGSKHAMVWVTSGDGRLLWRSDQYTLDNTLVYPHVTTKVTVPAGGEISEGRTWRQSYCTGTGDSDPVVLPPGRYTARGYWAKGKWWTPPLDFEIG